MKVFLFSLVIASLLALSGYCQPTSNPHRVFLVANWGDVPVDHSYWKNLEQALGAGSGNTTVLLNGDLLAKGFKLNDNEQTSRLARLLDIARQLPNIRFVIVPGDRDWSNSGPDGLEAVKSLEKYVRDQDSPNIAWALKNGCPGPQKIQLSPTLTLIAINTQWFNHPHDKPLPEDGTCKVPTQGEFMDELEEIIDESQDQNVLLAGHFPIFSLGRSGGNYPIGKYILPVPLISGMPIAYHQNVGSPRDISNDRFDHFRSAMQDFLRDRHSLIYTSGHDSDLQILDINQNFMVNSGSTLQGRFVSQSKSAVYATSQTGLISLVYETSGKVTADVLYYSEQGFKMARSLVLMESACEPSNIEAPSNTAFVPCRQVSPVLKAMSGTYPDSIDATGGAEYKAGALKTAFMGKHYRTSWATPVKVPVLNLDRQYDGLTPIDRGGGRQTKSVKLLGSDGRQYVFRSVNKDPVKALPYALRESFVVDVLRDQTSTQHPYGALVAAPLLNHIGVLHANPRLFIMPNDPKLGPFQDDYGNLLGMIEERPINPKKVEVPFEGAKKVKRSVALFRELYDDNHNRIEVEEFVRARVFDILVGDWGKHEDNWKWAGYPGQGGTIYRPIPRDRDHVFSRWDGLLPWLVDREWGKPSGENFNYKIKGLRSLMWQARHLDRFLANQADSENWVRQAQLIQESITDQDIETAVRNMPQEIYDISGQEISAKLKRRKEDLHLYARRYYQMLAREVDIVGSNEPEHFQITRLEDSRIRVEVTDPKNSTAGPFYSRTFDPEETREIRLYGLGGKDQFEFIGDSKNSILTRVVGGPGQDDVTDLNPSSKGKRVLIYEKSNRSSIKLGAWGKRVKSRDDRLYNYDRTRFAYNTYFPLSYFSYNSDNGFQLRLGVSFTRHRYDKDEFSTQHSFSGKVTTAGNFALDYHSRFHHAIGTWDVLTLAHVGSPNDFTNFFGIGNETIKIDSLDSRNFYRSRYNSYELGLGLGKQFWKISHFGITATYENNEGNLEANTILEPDSIMILGKDPLNLVESKGILNLDLRDSKHLPTKGIRLYADQSYGVITTENNTNYGVTNGWVEVYSSVNESNPITLGLVAGGALSFGDLPFYKAVTLGQQNHLRGYVSNRFSGERSFFFNSNLRFQLGRSRTALFPLKYGINGFYDLGKVFVDGETSKTWHKGYGGGFYLVPIEERFVFALNAAFSEEESLLILFKLGRVF